MATAQCRPDADLHEVDLTFELTKDEIYGVVTRPSPNLDSTQILCFTSDGFNPLDGLEEATICDDCASLRLGPPLRLREPNGDLFELPDPSRPWYRDEQHIRAAVSEPYTGLIYFATRSAIWRLDASDTVSRVAGHRSESGDADGPGDAARFDEPWVLIADGLGYLFTVSSAGERLARVQLPPPPPGRRPLPAALVPYCYTSTKTISSNPNSYSNSGSASHLYPTQPAEGSGWQPATSVTTLCTTGIAGKITAAAYDFASRTLLLATRQHVYCLPTTGAGCLASGEVTRVLQVVPAEPGRAAPATWSPWVPINTLATNKRQPAGTTTGARGGGRGSGGSGSRTAGSGTGGEGAAAAVSLVEFATIESLLVTSAGEVYVAETSDETDDEESMVKLWRLDGLFASANATAAAGGGSCSPAVSPSSCREDADGKGGRGAGGGGRHPTGGGSRKAAPHEGAGGEAAVEAAAAAAAEGEGQGEPPSGEAAHGDSSSTGNGTSRNQLPTPLATSPGSSSCPKAAAASPPSPSYSAPSQPVPGPHLVCTDLGLLCSSRITVLPHGWLLAHDYEGNLLRFLQLGLAPARPEGAELLEPPIIRPPPPLGAAGAAGCSNGGRGGGAFGSGGGNLAGDLGALLASQPDGTADLEVEVDGRLFPCHRVILGARCEYFRRLFACGLADSGSRVVTLPDARPDAFAALLWFMYTDRIDFDAAAAAAAVSPPPQRLLLRSVAELADRLLLPTACREAQRQLLAATCPGTVVEDLLWAEGRGMGQLAAALKDVFVREGGRVLLQAPDSLRQLVAVGAPDTVADLLVAAIQRAA